MNWMDGSMIDPQNLSLSSYKKVLTFGLGPHPHDCEYQMDGSLADEGSHMSGRICDSPFQKNNADPLSSCVLQTRQENLLGKRHYFTTCTMSPTFSTGPCKK